jgi:hypothetical protein
MPKKIHTMKKTIGIIMLSFAALILFGGFVFGMHCGGMSWVGAILATAVIFGAAFLFGSLIIYGLDFLTDDEK